MEEFSSSCAEVDLVVGVIGDVGPCRRGEVRAIKFYMNPIIRTWLVIDKTRTRAAVNGWSLPRI